MLFNRVKNKLYSHKYNILKTLILFLVFISLIYIISLFYFSFKPDEDVSMGLIQHNYHEIINIDSLDVHPPLYYLFLKLFVQITTFWTDSIFTKTMFARLFSFVLFVFFIILMFKIIKKIGININYKLQLVLFLIIPGVINESTKIRMYSLGAFLLVFELYELIKFYQNNDNKSIILATIFASLCSYTFYPLAISAGMFLLLYFLLQLMEKKKESIKIFISGIIFLILYIPWIPIIFNQMKIHSNDGSLVLNYFNSILASITQLNAPSPFSPLFKYISIASLIIIIFLFILIMYSINNLQKHFNNVFIISLINFITTILLSIMFCRRQFRPPISYPIFSILMFFIITIFIFKIHRSNIDKNKIFLFLSILSLFIFVGYMGSATLFNIKGYDTSSLKLINNFRIWNKTNNKNIDISKISNVFPSPSEINQYSIYLESINKKAIIPKSKYNINIASHESFNNSNKFTQKLFNRVFNNLKFK